MFLLSHKLCPSYALQCTYTVDKKYIDKKYLYHYHSCMQLCFKSEILQKHVDKKVRSSESPSAL